LLSYFRRDPDAEQQAQGEANAENDVVITTGRMGQMKAHAVSITNSGPSFFALCSLVAMLVLSRSS
jgi:hypothetical protein